MIDSLLLKSKVSFTPDPPLNLESPWLFESSDFPGINGFTWISWPFITKTSSETSKLGTSSPGITIFPPEESGTSSPGITIFPPEESGIGTIGLFQSEIEM